MPLHYALFDNPVTPDPADRMAIAQVNQAFALEDVIDRMISRGSTVTKAEALSVFEELCLAIETLVKDGNSVNTPLFKITPSIVGVFTSDEDTFDYSRHQVKLRCNPGLRLREIEQQISVEKMNAEIRQPVPLHFHDNVSESQDEVITPGGPARISGTVLKFDEADNNQGIFFVNIGNGAATRVSGKLLRNKPGELIFIAPQGLAAGTYKVEVRAIIKGGKSIRAGVLPYDLSVS